MASNLWYIFSSIWFALWWVPQEKEMATHPSILDRRIPWREEPGRLQSMGSTQRQTLLKQLSTHAWRRPSRKKAEIVKHCHLLLLFPHLLLKQVSFNLCLIEAKDVESSSSQISTGVRITWKVTKFRAGWAWRCVGGLRGRRYIHTYGWFVLMYGRNQHNRVTILQLKIK